MIRTICLLWSFLAITSCSTTQGGGRGGEVTGTWVGDFGPAFYDRNTISLELKWDGGKLTGMIRPGIPGGRMYRDFEGFTIENGAFDPKTGVVKFEATYRPRNRRYIIEGTVDRDTLKGTWNRPEENKDGDFKLTRQ
jgi:hypothetical protein